MFKRNNTSYFPQSFICQKTILGIHHTTKVFVSVSLCPLLQWHLYFVPRESGELTNLKPSNEAKQHLKSQQAQVERSSFFCYNILNNLLINLQDCNTEAINRITCGPVCDTWLFTQPLTLATDTRNKRFPSVVIG